VTAGASPRPPEFYRAPIDGQRCLRIEGRLRRLKLPLPAEPPEDVPPAACFLCHPERDRFDRGAWPAAPAAAAAHSALRVVGNAFSFATTALLVAPPDEKLHRATPAELPHALLAEILRAPFDARFAQQFGLAGLTVVAFMNVGTRAAQSRLHPHLQVVGFEHGETAADAEARAADARAIVDDVAAAEREGRRLALAAGAAANAIVPRAPAMTAELWIELPAPSAPGRAWLAAAADLATACAASARGLSGSYNVVLRCDEPRLARVIPRGLSERAGLELSFPSVVGSVIAASVRETQLLWAAALAR
jgi:hypothetical protein